MRYAIVSDIHANLQAWNAVLLDIRSLRVETIICLGDVVGYGPNPRETLESVYANADHVILGNHDAAACGMIDVELFNETARDVIEWTRTQLGPGAGEFFGKLPLSLQGDGFRCAHGDFSEPGCFKYIVDPAEAMPSWGAVSEPLLFVGHTHLPGLYLLGKSGVPHLIAPQDFVVEPDKRFLVNVGSVGQPRDDDTRACYCLYDTATQSVFWRRIPFDLDIYRSMVEVSRVPAGSSPFLEMDPRKGTAPVRAGMDFSPAQRPDKEIQKAVEVQSLDRLQTHVKRWRIAALLALLLAAGAACGGFWFRPWPRSHALKISAAVAPRSSRDEAVSGENMLVAPTGACPVNTPIPGWTVWLGDRRKHSVEVTRPTEGGVTFVLNSASATTPLSVRGVPVPADAPARYCLEAWFRKGGRFEGTIGVTVYLSGARSVEGEPLLRRRVYKEPSMRRKGGWVMAKHTFDVPAGCEQLEFELSGMFSGSVAVKNVRLYRKD